MDPGEGRQSGSTPARGAGLFSSIETWLTLAGAVGLVYVIGGAVMWLRFRSSHLPADQAVALVPKTDLLVAGLRAMILPAVAAAVLLVLLVIRQSARVDRRERTLAALRIRCDDLADDAQERPAVERRLKELTDQELRLWRGASRRRRVALGLACGLALIFVFVLPLSLGAFVWPVVALAMIVYWQRLPLAPNAGGEPRGKPSLVQIGAVAIIASAIVSVARQLDPTMQLPSVELVLAPADRGVPGAGLPTSLQPARRGGLVRGILVTASDATVAVGDPLERSITAYPRSRVIAMSIGRPLVPRTPPASLMSHLLAGDAWAWTPLKLWCGGDGYTWPHVGSACHTRPTVDPGALRASLGFVLGIHLSCPVAAQESCAGFVRVQTVAATFDPAQGQLLPAVISQGTYNVVPGRAADLQLPFDDKWKNGFLGDRRSVDVSIRVVLSRDALGDQVVYDDKDRADERVLRITRSIKKKNKEEPAPGQPPASSPPPTVGTGGGGPPPTQTPTAAPVPEPSPTATPPAETLVPPPSSGGEITAPPASSSAG